MLMVNQLSGFGLGGGVFFDINVYICFQLVDKFIQVFGFQFFVFVGQDGGLVCFVINVNNYINFYGYRLNMVWDLLLMVY